LSFLCACATPSAHAAPPKPAVAAVAPAPDPNLPARAPVLEPGEWPPDEVIESTLAAEPSDPQLDIEVELAPGLDAAWDVPAETSSAIDGVGPLVAPESIAPEPACFIAAPRLDAGAAAGGADAAALCGLVPDVPLAVPTPIEDPSGSALAAFRAAVERAESRQGQARIVFYGASHVASDLYTGLLRSKLASEIGSGGPGFFLPIRPWKHYRHSDVEVERSLGFRTRRIIAKRPLADAYGLSGVAFDAFTGRVASTAFTLSPRVVQARTPLTLELFFMQRAHGGSFEVFVDGARASRISTAVPRAQLAAGAAGYASLELPAGSKRVELRTLGDAPVRLFGVALERADAGVVLDTLGIPGSRAKYHLMWEDALYREHLAHRRPDLVVLAYGTNESGDDEPIERYEGELRKVVERVRQTAPQSSCLLIGPSDRPVRLTEEAYASAGGAFAQRPRTAAIIDVQRRVAAELGCGFFDVVRFMGGPLSMVHWVRHQPALGTPDHVHFTRAGYERMGQALYDALLDRAQPQIELSLKK
jgi:lysophospholipase L1-like esterase